MENMTKLEKINNKIIKLNMEIFFIKMKINSSYQTIPYKEIEQLTECRFLLKKQKYNLEKNSQRIKKLNKINNDN